MVVLMKKNNLIKLFVFVLINVILVGIDQYTKHLAVIKLKDAPSFVIIDGVLEFSYLRNAGAAWGILQGKQFLFIVLTILITAFIVYVLLKTPLSKRYASIYVVITLLSSGAIGNFIDRFKNGFVHDFIYFKLINFPIFNIADCYVTVSMILFAIVFLFVYRDGEFNYLKPFSNK